LLQYCHHLKQNESACGRMGSISLWSVHNHLKPVMCLRVISPELLSCRRQQNHHASALTLHGRARSSGGGGGDGVKGTSTHSRMAVEKRNASTWPPLLEIVGRVPTLPNSLLRHWWTHDGREGEGCSPGEFPGGNSGICSASISTSCSTQNKYI
jgi:hypothetical protein